MRRIVLASLLLIMTMMVFSCATPTPETRIVEKTVVVEKPVEKVVTVIVQPTVPPQTTKATEPVKTVDLTAIQAAYKLSSHSNDWGEGRGPNTYCARCHSPRNWDVNAKAGPAPNCMACKFPFDKEVRKPPAGTNTFIEQKDWKNIGCDICHQVNASGVVDPKPVMWNQATGKYDAVADNTALCEKCHADSIGGSKHKMTIGGPAHTTEIGLTIPRPQQCTDCHDPHSQQASCAKCHGDVYKTKPNTGHIAAHTKIACDACHDASGLALGPNADKTMWVAFQMTTSPAGGPPTASQVTSHVLQKAVVCTRCHYDNNPNKLRSMVTPTATRPATTGTPVAAPATPTAVK
jgi:hypothetical protein